MTISLARFRVAALHLPFWGLYISLSLYQFGKENHSWQQVLPALVVANLLNAALAYAHYLYLLPRYLRTRRGGEYALVFAALFVAVLTLRVGANRFLLAPVTAPQYLHSTAHTGTVAVGLLFLVLFVTLLYFATHWFDLDARTKALEHENVVTELRYLKGQLNPHFLFNTLNTLYYLAYSRSERTPEVVATLAQMMRYMLEEANRPAVELRREIEHLTSYIHLEKLRLNHPLPITLTVTGHPAGLTVAPLIFMAFLENAFKHGVSTTSSEAWIRVHFELTGPDCYYSVANSKLPPAGRPAGSTGTGLPNVRRRLALSYPNRHELQVEDLPHEYRIHLRLTL